MPAQCSQVRRPRAVPVGGRPWPEASASVARMTAARVIRPAAIDSGPKPVSAISIARKEPPQISPSRTRRIQASGAGAARVMAGSGADDAPPCSASRRPWPEDPSWQVTAASLIRAAGTAPDEGERGGLRNLALTMELADEPTPSRPLRPPPPTNPSRNPCVPSSPRAPAPKRPGWSAEAVAARAFLGRSHRAAKPKAQLKEAIDRTARLLGVPAGYRVGIVPASDTGAFEMAMWSMLGARPVDVLAWESFGQGWATRRDQAAEARRLPGAGRRPTARFPTWRAVRRDADVCFTWNGTTSGARVPDADWIAADREGLTFCDATSAAFAQGLDWAKLDVTTFSWQKAMGGEGGHGDADPQPARGRAAGELPAAAAAAEDLPPDQGRQADRGHLRRARRSTRRRCSASPTASTRSTGWRRIGGLPATRARADANFAALQAWVDRTAWVENLVADPGGAVEHLGLPEDRRSRDRLPRRGRRSATSSSG